MNSRSLTEEELEAFKKQLKIEGVRDISQVLESVKSYLLGASILEEYRSSGLIPYAGSILAYHIAEPIVIPDSDDVKKKGYRIAGKFVIEDELSDGIDYSLYLLPDHLKSLHLILKR